MKYVVTINQPGYLPTMEPAFFDTVVEAWDFVESELRTDEDSWWESDPNDAEGSGGEQLEANTYAHNGSLGTVHYHGYAYSVDVAEIPLTPGTTSILNGGNDA